MPATKPFDLFNPDRRHRVKLYVRRVFITDEAEGLVPPYLRFLRGVVDSEDLPLNISREMLQHNPMLAKIRSGIVAGCWATFPRRPRTPSRPKPMPRSGKTSAPCSRKASTRTTSTASRSPSCCASAPPAAEGLVSLDDYVGRMKEGQDAIFYITGEDVDTLRRSPQIEGFKARGVEVLLLTDPVDEFWIPSVAEYKEKKFKSVTRGGADLSRIKAENEPEKPEEAKPAENRSRQPARGAQADAGRRGQGCARSPSG